MNPLSTSRYRERHSTSGAKSDPGDARVLAELARVDGHNHRSVVGDSDLADAVKVLARAHHSMIWSRQRQQNQLRSTLREFFPAALVAFDDLASSDALAVLAIASTPAQGRSLSRSKIASALRRGGRQRRVEERAAEIQAALRAEHLEAPSIVADAMGASVAALVAIIAELVAQTAVLERELEDRFEQHPDEFGDDPNRYADAKSRKNAAGTSPITRASGKQRVVLARYAPNPHLADLCRMWAFAAITASPEARSLYDERPAAGDTPQPRATSPRQPARRHPPRLRSARHPLRRTHRLGTPRRTRRLTRSRPGMSSRVRLPVLDAEGVRHSAHEAVG